MAIDRTRYRQLDFIGARILQARELNWLQEIDQGVAVADNETSVSGQLQSLYRQGATKNVSIGISGLVATLSATDGAKPMEIFVRDRWEIFPGTNDDVTDGGGTYAAPHSITLGGTDTDIFLNWELKIRTGGLVGDDPSLTDATTNEAVASAGELILHLSNVDTSGVSLGGSQMAKNTAPVSVFKFTNSGTLLTLTPQDNVVASAQANSKTSGLVKTTTDNPIVVSTDDSRMGVATVSVADGLVHDSTVRVPVAPGGTNSDGTPVYNLSLDIGGISAAKIVYIAGTQLVSDLLTWVKTQISNLKNDFYSLHRNQALGSVNTHPMPTASDVGAAPTSHVGQPLGLVTSHPPVTTATTGGFRVNRGVSGIGSADDPAYGVFTTVGNVASLNHDGDIYSSKGAAFSVTSGGGLTASGALDHYSKLAQILRDHVNQQSHANPHGISAADIGAASTSYVDTAVANAIATSEAYADSLAGMTVRARTVRTGGTYSTDSANNLITEPYNTVTMNYTIFRTASTTAGLHFEIAIGVGSVIDGQTMPLPESSGWSLSTSTTVPGCLATASPQWIRTHYVSDTTAVIAAWWQGFTNNAGGASNVVYAREHANGHTANFGNCWANVTAFFWRTV